MKDSFAIDTNILFYALDSESDKQKKAVEFLENAEHRDSAIPLRALAELYNLALNRNKLEASKVREFINSIRRESDFEIIETETESLMRATQTEENFWDRLIEETAIQKEYKVLYTENASDFQKVETINPFNDQK